MLKCAKGITNIERTRGAKICKHFQNINQIKHSKNAQYSESSAYFFNENTNMMTSIIFFISQFKQKVTQKKWLK